MKIKRSARFLALLTVSLGAAGMASAQVPAPDSLKTVPVPLPKDLDHYVANRADRKSVV